MATNKSTTRSKSSRQKKPSQKVLESGDTWKSRVAVDSTKWCKVYCEEDNKCYTVGMGSLETEDSNFLTEANLKKGQAVLLKFKGKKYTSTIVEVYDSKPATSKRQRQDKFQEDSSSDEESNSVPPKRSKPLYTPTKTTKLVSSDSDSDVAETGGNDLSGEIAESGQDDLSGEIPAKPSSTVTTTCVCTNSTELTRISTLLTELLEKYTDTATKVERMYTFLKQGRSVGKGEVTQADVHVRPCKDGDVASDPSEDETKFVSDKGVRLLGIRAHDPPKYALALMDAIFTDEEMGTCCFVATKRSTKPPLPAEKVKLIEECVDRKYGKGTMVKYENDIKKKANQKCIDVLHKRMKLKSKENITPEE